MIVDSEVWSASHDCCDFSESSSAWRLVSWDSIQMMSLSGVGLGEQQLDPLEAGLLRPHPHAGVDDLRGDVLRAAGGRAQRRRPSRAPTIAAPNAELGTRITSRAYDVSPSSSVSVFSSVMSPPCASTIRWTSRRVSPTSLLVSETAPVAMIERSICGAVATDPSRSPCRRRVAAPDVAARAAGSRPRCRPSRTPPDATVRRDVRRRRRRRRRWSSRRPAGPSW